MATVETLFRELLEVQLERIRIAALVGRARGLIDTDASPTVAQVRGAQTALAEAYDVLMGNDPE